MKTLKAIQKPLEEKKSEAPQKLLKPLPNYQPQVEQQKLQPPQVPNQTAVAAPATKLQDKKDQVKMVIQQQQIVNRDEDQPFPLIDFLPIKVDDIYVKQLTWDEDFSAQPDPDSPWLAHAYWNLGYSYAVDEDESTKQVTNQANKQFKLTVSVWSKLKSNCWVRSPSKWLLNHECGHYVMGCITALEFQKRAHSQLFTINYQTEIKDLFNSTLRQYLQIQKDFDNATGHGVNDNHQDLFDGYMMEQLKALKAFFENQLDLYYKIMNFIDLTNIQEGSQ